MNINIESQGTKISIILIATAFLISVAGVGIIIQQARAQSLSLSSALSQAEEFSVIQGNSLLPVSSPVLPLYPTKTVKMIVTAYSSTVWQTDSDPFTTASGKTVANGIVANNLLPFGTRIRIPEIYGNRIFIVEDRMNSRKGSYHMDIWFPEYEQAKDFGVKKAYIEVLEN